jgi:hypothetical protein
MNDYSFRRVVFFEHRVEEKATSGIAGESMHGGLHTTMRPWRAVERDTLSLDAMDLNKGNEPLGF